MALEKQELKLLTELISGLFSRKQKFIYIGASKPDVWYFSNNPPAENYVKDHPGIFIHQNTSEDFYHRLTFTDDSQYTLLYNYYPQLVGRDVCISVADFVGVINKKLDVSVCGVKTAMMVNSKRKKIITQSIVPGEDIIGCANDNKSVYRVATFITPSHVHVIKDLIDDKYGNVDECYVEDLPKECVDHSMVKFYSLPWHGSDKYYFNFPIHGGHCCPAVNSYTKKHKDLEFTFSMLTYKERNSLRHMLRFKTTDFEIISITPAAVWFPLSNKKPTES